MKKFFTVLGIILLVLFVLGRIGNVLTKSKLNSLTGKSEFEQMVEQADKECPIPVSYGMINHIKLENGFVTYYMSCNDEKAMHNWNADDFKEVMVLYLLCDNSQKDQGEPMMDMLIQNNTGVRFLISGLKDPRTYTITVDNMKDIKEKYQQNPQEATHKLLTMTIESERTSLPAQIDEGMFITDMQLEGNNIVFYVQLDENLYSIKDMKSSIGLIKQSIMCEGLNSPECETLLDLCETSHSGIIYRMYGKTIKNRFDVNISNDDIRKIISSPGNTSVMQELNNSQSYEEVYL